MASWPAVGSEELEWVPAHADDIGPGLSSYLGGRRVYTASVPAFIADATVDLPDAALTAAEEAGRELSRFDAELGHRVAAFGPVLLRSEAAASSQIEQLTASARAILTAELTGRAARNATLIAANTASLRAAIALADDITSDSIAEMHAVLMAGQPHHTPGRWRTEPVWIGTDSRSPVGADFVAPRWDRVPALIEDLVAFARRTDIGALSLTAISHAQFETIHPFTDGNGRTGRALAQALLRHRAVTRAVVNARELVGDIDQILAGWRTRIRARSDSGVWRVLDVVARTPVVDAAHVARELGIRQQNAYPLLRALTDQGVLTSKAEYRVGTLWRSDEILRAIDRFSERAGHRTGPQA